MVGGRDEMFENFVWLPIWEECRSWLKEKGVSDERVADGWRSGVSSGVSDREAMYALILEVLEGSE